MKRTLTFVYLIHGYPEKYLINFFKSINEIKQKKDIELMVIYSNDKRQNLETNYSKEKLKSLIKEHCDKKINFQIEYSNKVRDFKILDKLHLIRTKYLYVIDGDDSIASKNFVKIFNFIKDQKIDFLNLTKIIRQDALNHSIREKSNYQLHHRVGVLICSIEVWNELKKLLILLNISYSDIIIDQFVTAELIFNSYFLVTMLLFTKEKNKRETDIPLYIYKVWTEHRRDTHSVIRDVGSFNKEANSELQLEKNLISLYYLIKLYLYLLNKMAPWKNNLKDIKDAILVILRGLRAFFAKAKNQKMYKHYKDFNNMSYFMMCLDNLMVQIEWYLKTYNINKFEYFNKIKVDILEFKNLYYTKK